MINYPSCLPLRGRLEGPNATEISSVAKSGQNEAKSNKKSRSFWVLLVKRNASTIGLFLKNEPASVAVSEKIHCQKCYQFAYPI